MILCYNKDMGEKLKTKTKESTGEPDIQSRELAQVALESFKEEAEKIMNEAPAKAKKYFAEAREVERAFDDRNKKLAKTNAEMNKKEFECWEDELDFELKLAERQIEIGKMNFNQIGEAKREIVTYFVDTELSKTIEAQAGEYFFDRERELELALRKNGTEEELKYLHNFYQTINQHLDFKYMTREEMLDYGYDNYEKQRTKAHNDAIRHLNGINDLARKYGTRPFTVRNFWTSDLKEKNAQTDAVAKVMRYDRDIVEEYYAIAFKSDVTRRETKIRKTLELGLY